MSDLYVRPDIAFLQGFQDATLEEGCSIVRNGDVIAETNMRVGAERTFSEPSDPQDASARAQVEWGYTFTAGQDVQPGDLIQWDSQEQSSIIGDVLAFSTWELAVRAFGTRPKFATATVALTLIRYNPTTDRFDITVPPQDVRLLYDHINPQEAPIRYQPSGRSLMQTGRFAKEHPEVEAFDVQIGDRFSLFGYPGEIIEILGGQPLATEARFQLDVGGAR